MALSSGESPHAMPNRELSLFSYEILGLVGRQGAAPHDLLRLAKRGRFFAWAGESQYYTEPKRLARLGYLASRKEPGKTHERTVYSLTDKGLEALRDYARTPVTFTPLKSDPLVRLLICDLVGEDVTRESMTTLRDDIAKDAKYRWLETLDINGDGRSNLLYILQNAPMKNYYARISDG